MDSISEAEIINMRQQAFDHLKKFYGLDDQTIETLLAKAATTLGKDLESLQKAAEADDLAEIKRLGHALKGALLNLGLEALSELAKEIEQTTTQDEMTIKAFLEKINDSGIL